MKIEGIIWLRDIVDKLALKHHVETHEVEEVLSVANLSFVLLRKGNERVKVYT